MNAKSQHFNPQCYLRGFQQKKRLWQYDLAKGTVTESTAKKSGCEEYYHAVDLEDGSRDDQTLEKVFHSLENELPKLFEAIRWGRPLSPEVWSIFFAFITVQDARSPKRVQRLNDFLGSVCQSVYPVIRASKRMRAALAAEGIDPAQVLDNYELRPSRGTALLTSLSEIDFAESLFAQMKWNFLKAPVNKFFITGDAPVSLWSPAKRSPFPPALADRDIEVTFPLSRSVCAFGCWGPPFPDLYPAVPEDVVDAINGNALMSAARFVYGPVHDSRLLETVMALSRARAKGG
ncbi:MAG: DUF4238 domain-containing protein [Limisphaerales bacterium]